MNFGDFRSAIHSGHPFLAADMLASEKGDPAHGDLAVYFKSNVDIEQLVESVRFVAKNGRYVIRTSRSFIDVIGFNVSIGCETETHDTFVSRVPSVLDHSELLDGFTSKLVDLGDKIYAHLSVREERCPFYHDLTVRALVNMFHIRDWSGRERAPWISGVNTDQWAEWQHFKDLCSREPSPDRLVNSAFDRVMSAALALTDLDGCDEEEAFHRVAGKFYELQVMLNKHILGEHLGMEVV